MPRAVAKKVKTPPPPRRVVQAPKVRTAPRDEGLNRKILYALGASGLVLLAAVIGFLLFAGGDDSENAQGAVATLRAAGWTYQHPKDQGRTHVPAFQGGFKYNTVPGTSGQHSNQTVIYGPYDDPVSEINYVHNLEHGAVGIFYGDDVPEATVNQLREYYTGDPNGLILAPDPRLGDQIALTAWTHIAKGKTFDEDAFDAFVDTFGFNGPESCKNALEQGCFRRENMAPGNQ
jgi:Protein of unknown function (DUF3105)